MNMTVQVTVEYPLHWRKDINEHYTWLLKDMTRHYHSIPVPQPSVPDIEVNIVRLYVEDAIEFLRDIPSCFIILTIHYDGKPLFISRRYRNCNDCKAPQDLLLKKVYWNAKKCERY